MILPSRNQVSTTLVVTNILIFRSETFRYAEIVVSRISTLTTFRKYDEKNSAYLCNSQETANLPALMCLLVNWKWNHHYVATRPSQADPGSRPHNGQYGRRRSIAHGWLWKVVFLMGCGWAEIGVVLLVNVDDCCVVTHFPSRRKIVGDISRDFTINEWRRFRKMTTGVDNVGISFG